jgi:hypothetical protein
MICRALAVVVVLLAVASTADAAVMCKTRSGTVKIRDACRPRETVVDPVALNLQGPRGVSRGRRAARVPR